MNLLAEQFLDSLRAQLSSTAASLGKFMVNDTYINGEKFSFEGHEYQEYITDLVEANPGFTFVIKKCSQIGISEWANRFILSKMAVKPGTSALVSFPSKQFSQEVLKTRFASIIQESPRLRGLINRDIDSASVKAFHNNSIMYALGGSKSSNSSLLNRPISTVLVDELDRQDLDIITGYRSRMTHTKPIDRLIIEISTPTVQDLGIDAEFNECGETHHPYTVCNHCGHEFQPDYYEHIRLPGYEDSLMMLTKVKAATLSIDAAYLECPECKGNIDEPAITWRVEKNPIGMKKKIGVELTPFTAHAFISMPDLVESSLTYTSSVEFLNQGLGKTANLRDSSIQREHVHVERSDRKVGQYVFGLDMGKVCHMLVGVMRADTTIHVTEAHVVKLPELEEFLTDIHRRIAFTAGVIDSMPYADLVYKLIRKYPRLFSAIYVSPMPPMPELYKLKMVDKHNEMVRQISINKGPMMDLMANSMDHFVTFEPSQLEGMILSHLLDMRRMRDYRFEEMVYQWVKSKKGEDHFFHTLTYLFTATKIAQANLVNTAVIPVTVGKFSTQPKPEVMREFREKLRG